MKTRIKPFVECGPDLWKYIKIFLNFSANTAVLNGDISNLKIAIFP